MKLLVNIDVPGLDMGIAFYEGALGLTHTSTIDDDVAELSGATCMVYLLEKAAGSPTNPSAAGTRQYARHWTPVHIDFVVDRIDEAVERALLADARQESDYVEWMGSTCVTFSDPFGNGFCLIQFAKETYRPAKPSELRINKL
jgi:predicted enzyme related to lactoylglutathione lyase